MELKFSVWAFVAAPPHEVFEAVADPGRLSRYFTTGGAVGRLEAGTTVTWDFADFPGAFPVHVREVVPERLIELQWQAADGEYDTTVRMEFEALDDRSTLIRISESGWKETQKGLDSSYGNCSGWMQMLCCLKVYAEQGGNLREFFF